MRTLRNLVAFLFLTFAWLGSGTASALTLNLCTFPATGQPVPSGTVLGDQWRAVGILFDARPATVDPIMKSFGGSDCQLFFNPDQFGVVAVFTFVQPGTTIPTDATSFTLVAYYNPGESAQLVGLDSSSNVVAQAQITPAQIGASSRSLAMTISGNFRTVEWRTQGDPGIAAGQIDFELAGSSTQAIPTLSEWALIVLSLLLIAAASYGLKKRFPSA